MAWLHLLNRRERTLSPPIGRLAVMRINVFLCAAGI
jgi:hypothetical protein